MCSHARYICDLICNKGPLLSKHLWHAWFMKRIIDKHLKNSLVNIWSYHEELCIYNNYMYWNCFWDDLTVVLFHEAHHKCFARRYPYCKLGHIYRQLFTNLFISSSIILSFFIDLKIILSGFAPVDNSVSVEIIISVNVYYLWFSDNTY